MPYNEKSLENLKSWVPGQSGNPKGSEPGVRKRKTIISQWIACDSGLTDADDKTLTAEDVGWIEIIKKFMQGDLKAAQLIYDYLEGKAQDNKKVTILDSLSSMTREEKIKLHRKLTANDD